MCSVQRRVGRKLQKSPGDNAKVGVLLSEYEDCDKILAQIAEHTKTWRDAWINMVLAQLGIATEYEGLWDPVQGADEALGRNLLPTPETQLTRTHALLESFTELRSDVMEEVTLIEGTIIKPCVEARECLSALRKKIKKRENLRLDHEHAQDKVAKLRSKMGRSQREDKALAKAEGDWAVLKDEFKKADDQLLVILPPLLDATFSIIPPLLEVMVATQNRLLGLCYTTLHNFCEDYNFPSPPPPMETILDEFSANYDPARHEVETLMTAFNSKAARFSLRPGEGPKRPALSPSPSSQSLRPLPPANPHVGIKRAPSSTSMMSTPQPTPTPRIPSSTKPPSMVPGAGTPTDFTTASRIGTGLSPAAARPRGENDYFGNRRPSTSSIATTATSATTRSTATLASTATTATTASFPGNGAVAAAAAKKKPPPPPPKKKPSMMMEFVVALYDFQASTDGDLTFSEGDRIRVVKKTGTDQDWWVGEVGGVRGNFPANYCKAA